MRLKKIFGDLLIMSRGERNGVIVLVLLIVFALLFKLLIPQLHRDDTSYLESMEERQPEDAKNSLPYEEPIAHEGTTNAQKPLKPMQFFYFDPNTLSSDSLQMLGIPARTTHTLVKYREKGGKFYNARDLLKVYGFDTLLFQTLLPWVAIAPPDRQKAAPEQLVEHKVEKQGSKEKWILEINSADSAAWTRLPGVGPVYARRICNFRKALGGFVSIEQLKEVYKFPPETYALILPQLSVDTTLVRTIDLNFADAGELMRHPYCNADAAKKIVAHRSVHGPFNKVQQLLSDSLLNEHDYHKLSAYLHIKP